ncbi:hypothetical protein PI95_031300 [Hassallia byssoidea VB512170]|uniref:Uncharacterized protein n=1 Tax=Hassallia byssoidea VB512170 TaxID=1304833 RepID=A0A846HIX1_9CYAN|nr:hypothetical protein [Hassalia byssoidea VB512170]
MDKGSQRCAEASSVEVSGVDKGEFVFPSSSSPSSPSSPHLPIPPFSLSPVAHGGDHGRCYNGGNLRNALPPQDRAGSPFPTPHSPLPIILDFAGKTSCE